MKSVLEKIYYQQVRTHFEAEPSFWTRRHPAVHLIAMIAYVLVVASFPKYATLTLMPFVLFPAGIFLISGMPLRHIGGKLLWIEPFIVFVALMNPIFEPQTVAIGTFVISVGWLTCISIVLKSLLTLTVALQMGLVLRIEGLVKGLTALRVPSVFIMVVSLMFRYLVVLLEETVTLFRAYRLRAPHHKGIHYSQWGSFAGHLILRSYDRALRIENAMRMRGFSTLKIQDAQRMNPGDVLYLASICLYLMGVKYLSLI